MKEVLAAGCVRREAAEATMLEVRQAMGLAKGLGRRPDVGARGPGLMNAADGKVADRGEAQRVLSPPVFQATNRAPARVSVNLMRIVTPFRSLHQ